MTRMTILLAAGAATVAAAIPAAAQTPYQYPNPQPGYAYPQQGYPQQGYPQGYAYPNQPSGYGNQGYYPAQMRVTAITDVRRRNNGVRVSGLLDSSGGAYPPYGNAYGYQGQGQAYAAQGDLTFRCNVDYRGAVSNVRIDRNKSAYNNRRGY